MYEKDPSFSHTSFGSLLAAAIKYTILIAVSKFTITHFQSSNIKLQNEWTNENGTVENENECSAWN
jgi:hypothetical protein